MFFAFYSCEEKKVTSSKGEQEKIYSQSLLAIKKSYQIQQEIDPSSLSKLEDWKQYGNLTEFIHVNYLETSPNQSFEMSKELVEMVKSAKDSLKIRELRKLGVYARLNTLHSEALRLQDMSTISSIKANEVEVQTEKIISIFSSINAKIISVFEQQNFDEGIDFDEKIFEFREEPELIFPNPKKRVKRRNSNFSLKNKVK